MRTKLKFQSPTSRRPLTRAEAARVIAAPLPKRTQGDRCSIAGPLAAGALIAVAYALAWIWAIVQW
jgi:hypothetical protein